MKKLLSIAAVLVLLLTLTVPVLAAEVNYPSVSNGEIEATSESGIHVIVDNADPNSVDENKLLTAVKSFGKVSGDDYGIDLFNIYAVDDAGNKIQQSDPITFSFEFQNADLLVDVLIQSADGSWSEVGFSVAGKTLTINAPHLTPFAMVIVPRNTAPTDNSGKVHSPFTGDYAVLWAAAAVAMALCAGTFFVSARKRKAE